LAPQHDTTRFDIPTVAFYGETDEWSTAALLHSEPLIERSRLHAWKIRPHRHSNLLQLFWLSEGHGLARFDTDALALNAPCIAVIPERCVHEFQWSHASEGYALSIASALTQELRSSLGLSNDAFRHATVLQAGDDARYLDMLFRRIQSEYSGEAQFQEAALESLVRALAVWIARHTSGEFRTSKPASRGSIHFSRFSKLVDEHHREHWNVNEYAHALGVSPSHLNAVCHRHGGTSAKRLIQARILLAARRELAYTDKSIADVAAALGFPDASYFTRFFRRSMRMTPREFRRRSGTHAGQH
jgi:AraC family transcriptional activator of pobA